MRMPQGAEWLILLLIVVLLFGAKRLPDAARGLGRSLRIFKAETKALGDEDAPASADVVDNQQVAAPKAVAAPAEPVAAPAEATADPAPVARADQQQT